MMQTKRMIGEVEHLKAAIIKGTIVEYFVVQKGSSSIEEVDHIIVSFCGPKETPYEQKVYTVRFEIQHTYPFRNPQCFFIGEPPVHAFYNFDLNNINRPKRITNLANTDFGIMYERTPQHTLVDIVQKIQYSLTPTGKQEMYDHMEHLPV